MKKSLLISTFLMLLAFTAFSQTFVSTDPQPRNVVLEEFTGIYCVFCPQGHSIAKQIKDANPGRVVLINVHEGSFSNPSNPDHPDFRTPWGAAILQMSNLSGFPAGQINRQVFEGAEYAQQKPGPTSLALNRNGWTAATDVILNSGNSPVNIAARTVRSQDSLYITVEAYFTDDVPAGALLNIVLLEDGYIGYQTGGAEDYIHNHILRDMVTGQWGDAMPQTAKGSLFTKTYAYKITDRTNYLDANLKIALFVTNADHKNIFTGVEYEIPKFEKLASLTLTGSDMLVVAAGAPRTTTFSLENISNSSITFELSVEGSSKNPSDWTANITNPVNPLITIPAGESKEITVSASTSANISVGGFTLIAKEKDTENKLIYKSSFSVASAEITSLQVIASSEASRSFSAIFAQRNHTGFLNIEPADFARIAPFLGNLELVVWNGGIAGTIGSTDQIILNNLYKDGVRVFITGATITGSLTASTLQQYGVAYNGFSTQGYGSSPWTVWLSGVDGDPITGAIGNNVEGNLISYLISLYKIANTQIAVPFMTFKYDGKRVVRNGSAYDTFDVTGPEAIFGVRVEDNGNKAVLLAMHPAIVKTLTTRYDLVDNIIKWLKGMTDVIEAEKAPELEIYPNPAANDLFIKNIVENSEFAIYSSSGSIVKSGVYKSSLSVSDLPAGAYYLNIGGEILRFVKN